ncbi:actin-like protein arp8 [Turnera subulata]|uniref:Actin-like protein arp8 n=1 Tax=Turnera subulata TaxID=218843 RepID=A0A9Q0J3L3_9ROSI|nr:actin-like protein arp8 [Turnera subulata]
MAMLLRKVWESVSNRGNNSPTTTTSSSNSYGGGITIRSSSSSGSGGGGDGGGGLGPLFDGLPVDVVMQIVRMAGPREAARLSAVSRSWRCLISSDNRLWIFFLHTRQYHDASSDSVFFAETNLRSGYPIQRCLHSLKGGAGYCKFGWSKYPKPSGKSATFLEFGNIESPLYSRLRHFFATIYSRMQVRPSAQPIVLSLPLCHYDDTESARASRRQLKDAILTALFDMNVPAVCAINQATLALYAARRTSGVVVNIGFHVTSVVPILHGKVMRSVGVESIGVGALKVTGYLREQMQQNNMNFESLYTVRTLKELASKPMTYNKVMVNIHFWEEKCFPQLVELCYVAADYEAELSKETTASLEVRGDGQFTLSKERFKTGEVLFQPRLAGLRAMGLHQAVALCMDHCHAAELTGDDNWFKTVVLSGGTACLPGLAGENLEVRKGIARTSPLINLQRNKSDSSSLWGRYSLVRCKDY